MDLNEIQQQVDAYIGQFKEGYFPPLVNLARLTEEVGELAREIDHAYGPRTRKHDEPEGDIALEPGDILFVGGGAGHPDGSACRTPRDTRYATPAAGSADSATAWICSGVRGSAGSDSRRPFRARKSSPGSAQKPEQVGDAAGFATRR